MKNDSALFYTCSLIELIGRMRRQPRSEVVRMLGHDTIRRIYTHADVFHSEPIEKTASEFIELKNIPEGDFDNVARCRYLIPDYWTIGEVYERLIEDTIGAKEADASEVTDTLMEVYSSWMDRALSNYNTDLYYQPRDYISLCYREGQICA